MKISGTILSALLGLSLVTAIPTRGQAELHKDATLPAHPAKLLSVLPKPPPGWKVNKSTGNTRLASWVVTDAERILQKVEFAEGEDPNRPPVTQIKIRDTGNFPGYLDPFANFVPDGPDQQSDPRRMLLGSFPAFVKQDSSAGLNVKLLAGKRYVIEMVLQNQADTNIGLWLKAIDFQALSSIDNTPLSSVPSEIQIIFVDELEPENDTDYVTTITQGNMAAKTGGATGLTEADRAELAQEAEDARIAAEDEAAATKAAAAAAAAGKSGAPAGGE